MKKLDLAAAVTATLALTSISHAQFTDGLAIGINFAGGAGSEAPDPDIDTVDLGELTGVVPRDNWVNAIGANGALASLMNSAGTVTTATVNWTSNNTWGRNVVPSPNNDLLSDYLDGGTGVPAAVIFDQIPFAIYDVYVYTRRNETADPNDTTPNTSPGKFSDYTLNNTLRQDVLTGDIQNNFVLATPTVIGNYIKYEDVTGATMRLDANLDAANTFRAPIDGVQIVQQVPEPASVGAATLGLISLLGLRRFRRR